ncbi:MAG: alpha-galactosidase [Victivallaceae bacterium]|nr:alpha-galactosidase [Victivallaceae bacterium]
MSTRQTKHHETSNVVVLENGIIRLEFNKHNGRYCICKSTGELVFKDIKSGFTTSGNISYYVDEYPKRTFIKKKISDWHGEGIELTVVHSSEKTPELTQKIFLYDNIPFFLTEILISNISAGAVAVKDLYVFDVTCADENNCLGNIASDLWIFRYGTRMPSDPVFFCQIDHNKYNSNIDEYFSPNAIKHFINNEDRYLTYMSESIAGIKSNSSKREIFVGFTTLHDQACQILFKRQKNNANFINITARSNAENFLLAPGMELKSERLMFDYDSGTPKAIQTYLAEIEKNLSPLPPPQTPPIAWSSWNYYRKNATENDIIENMELLKKNKWLVEYIVVDDCYQDEEMEWLATNDKFPHGMKWMAGEISKRGYKPGIWIAPFTTNSHSFLVKKNPEWCVKDKAGNPLFTYSNFGLSCAIDFTVPEARGWLQEVINTLVNEWGYRYIKLDGPDRRYYEGMKGFKEKNITTVQNIRMAYEVIRKAAGNALIEGEGYYGPAIGYANTHRVSQDIQTRWLEIKNSTRVPLMSGIIHNRFWHNIPTSLILRKDISPYTHNVGWKGEEPQMSEDEMRLVLTTYGLLGGETIIADKVNVIPPDRKKLASKILPPYTKAAAMVDLYNGLSAPRIYNLKIDKNFESWNIVGVFNWEEDEEKICFNVSDIGLENKKLKYHIFDFWNETYLGTASEKISINVAPHSTKLLCIRKVLTIPQLLSTSMHFTQGAVEFNRLEYDSCENVLCLDSSFHDQNEAKIFIYLPDGYTLPKIKTVNVANYNIQNAGNIAILNYTGKGKVHLEMFFKKI